MKSKGLVNAKVHTVLVLVAGFEVRDPDFLLCLVSICNPYYDGCVVCTFME